MTTVRKRQFYMFFFGNETRGLPLYHAFTLLTSATGVQSLREESDCDEQLCECRLFQDWMSVFNIRKSSINFTTHECKESRILSHLYSV